MNMDKVEQTLIIIKPDGMKRSLTGNILAMLSHPNNIIVGAKVVQVTRDLVYKVFHQVMFISLLSDSRGAE